MTRRRNSEGIRLRRQKQSPVRMDKNIDEHPGGLVEEDVVLYPTLEAELPVVTISHDIPVMAVEDEIAPQGRAEGA